jgi:hypothetical protein
VLRDLKNELGHFQESMKSDCSGEDSRGYLEKVKSETVISMGCSQGYLANQMWESKYQEPRGALTPHRLHRNRTSENWTNNLDKRALFQSEEKRQAQGRYHSAEKPEGMRKSSRPKKGSDHTDYNLESKTSIRLHESVRGSRVGTSSKPATETCIRLEQEFSKGATPSTLHKKVASAKGYSKYRFQPAYRLE